MGALCLDVIMDRYELDKSDKRYTSENTVNVYRLNPDGTKELVRTEQSRGKAHSKFNNKPPDDSIRQNIYRSLKNPRTYP